MGHFFRYCNHALLNTTRKMHHWKILYFHNTVKPHFTDTSSIRTPQSLLRTVCFVPEKRKPYNANVEKTGMSERRKTNRFNNNKSLTVQDESDMNTPEEENAFTIYNSNTMPRALPAGITFSLNST